MTDQRNEQENSSGLRSKKSVSDSAKKITDKYRKVLATTEGRDVIWDLLSYCGIYHDQFTGNSETFRNLGMKKVGLKIIAEINKVDPKAYAKLLLEHDCDSK